MYWDSHESKYLEFLEDICMFWYFQLTEFKKILQIVKSYYDMVQFLEFNQLDHVILA